ncbi:hypothetical protein [Paenibacillus silvisoli]|uniref:hypothetical protein n=1 Tax=Paenibacillus silvisoli TaxID=3110539 RepID=UPI002805482B|nr:hypothetical protein [Paenibacillus silvisoli]
MLGAINALNKKPNGGIGYDHLKKKVVTSQITPHTSTAGGVLDTLNARVTNQAAGAVSNALAAPKQPPQFSYDAASDPSYQAALRQAQANANTASGNAQAEMNRRGILNSTITGDRVAQIQQSEMGRVSDTILPQLMQQAYGRYRDTIDDGYRNQQLDLQKGQLTGTYINDDMRNAYDTVLQAKQDYANAKTPEERIAAHQRAEAARAILGGMNANSGLVGADVTLDKARGNQSLFGTQTQSAREYDTNMAYNKERDKRGDFENDRNYNRGVLESDRGFNRGVLESDRNYNRGVLESDRGYNRGVFENDRAFNRNAFESDRSYSLSKSNSATDNARAGSSQTFNQLMDIWQATGKAPAGIAGVEPGTLWNGGGKSGGSSNDGDDLEADFNSDYKAVLADPAKAYSRLVNNYEAFIDKYGPSKYQQLLRLATPKEDEE